MMHSWCMEISQLLQVRKHKLRYKLDPKFSAFILSAILMRQTSYECDGN